MLDQIFVGSRFISKAKTGLIYSRYDGLELAEQIDNLYDTDKAHLQTFPAYRLYCKDGKLFIDGDVIELPI